MLKRLISLILALSLFASCALAEETVPAETPLPVATAEPTPMPTATPEPVIRKIGVADLMTAKLEVVSAEKTLAAESETDGTERVLQADLSGTHLTLTFAADKTVTDDIWSAASTDLLTGFAYLDWSDPKALVNAVAESLKTAPAAGTEAPVWQTESLKAVSVKAENPYYPELSMGINGEMTKKLQQRLIETGFLTDKADGYFGKNTLAAVNSVQEYVSGQLQALKADDPYTEIEPLTEGTVSPELLFYLLSDEFRPYTGSEVTAANDAGEILRLQRRLIAFGCLTGSADGLFGDNTARGVRIFQYANDLPQTGIADSKTLDLLFGTKGKSPAHSLMTTGSSGDEVKKLQERLLISGFSTFTPDGKFEKGTASAIENLQFYFQVQEKNEKLAKASSVNAPSEPGTISENAVETEIQYETVLNGIADPLLLDKFYADDFEMIPKGTIRKGDSGEDVKRIQRRLKYLEYSYDAADGAYGPATESAVTAFQKRHKLEQTGICDQATIDLLFSSDAKVALKPYVLKVSIDKQRVYAYAPDENDEYTILKRTMKCSTGLNSTPTPKGTYQATTGPGRRWHYFSKFDCWAQYAWHITGDILFHSVIYYEKEGKMQTSTLSNLGRKASHGCVRLSVEDAQWIYNHCPKNTKVIIY